MTRQTEAQNRQTAQPASHANDIDRRLVKAMAHPLRHRVLVLLNEKVASPNELARELGERLGNVSYHVRILLDLGAIELVRTTPRRGALEHHYRAMLRPWFPEAEWAQLPLSTRRAIFGQNIRRIFDDVAAAGAEGGFDHAKAHVSWTALNLDDEGLSKVADILDATLEQILDAHAESTARMADAGASEPPPLATEVAILHFERSASEPGKGLSDRSSRARRPVPKP
jgi:DNA-binding transcriptional ArsR family regulator